jgi:hypothetical protein
MSDQVTLTQLAADMAHLRRQIEIVNQRLDMIYGAVTRLAEAQHSSPPPAAATAAPEQPSSVTTMPLSAEMMMDPSGMLDSLRQYALNAGLNISSETVDRLKSKPPAGETEDGSS